MPLEVVQMIVNETFHDTKSFQRVRATSKLFKELSEKHFRESYLTHLIVSPTTKALTRLSWTVQEPELAANIQSITVTYDNTDVTHSDGLCPGMWIRGEVDHLLSALRHLQRMGKQVDLVVKIAKTPTDGTGTIVSTAYPVLVYVLSGHGAQGIKRLFLDFDDSASTHLPFYTTSQQMLTSVENFGLRYQRFWACIKRIKTFSEVRIRFSKKDEKTNLDSERYLTIVRYNRGIHLGMQFLTTWHFDMMGCMSIFDNIFSLTIIHSALISRHRRDLFNNRNLQVLVLWNASLYDVHRSVNPTSIVQNSKSWGWTLRYIAARTTLETLQVYCLREANGQYLHLDPWTLSHTQERSISQAIFVNHPS